MELNESILKNEERISFLLRDLYLKYGYRQYKMSKFEEYDLYARNRDFLVSGDVITFTDKNGRLMALKPDVTLSIVRNTRDIAGYVEKVYYNENVYRVPGGSNAFKEIMQAGIECIGDIDDYNIFETVYLAAKSLELISEDSKLNISHLGIIISLLDRIGLIGEGRKRAIKLIADKNMHELKSLLEEKKATDIDRFIRIIRQSGSPSEVLRILEDEGCDEKAVEELKRLCSMLEAAGEIGRIVIDFSVVSDMRYYNGIAFKGYISGVPESILSGGQYDKLLKKLGKSSRAIGFAVYMDFLERYFEIDCAADTGAVIKYDSTTDRRVLYAAVESMVRKGVKCTALRELPEKPAFNRVYTLQPDGSLKDISGTIREQMGAGELSGKEAHNA